MKNLADFKRALKVGSVWDAEYLGPTLGSRVLGRRPVMKVGPTIVHFQLPDGRPSRLEFPKASECQFDGDTVTILEDGKPILRYTLIH